MSLNVNAEQCIELKSLIERILKLGSEYKYLDAKGLYNKLIGKLKWNSELEDGRQDAQANPHSKVITDLLAAHKDTFEMILCRVDEVEYALNNLSLDQEMAATESDVAIHTGGGNASRPGSGSRSGDRLQWQFGSRYLGVTTHFVVRPDGLLTVHVEGVVDNLPFFEQLAVINEIDLFSEWVPFCHSSEELHRVGPAELLAHFHVSLGLFSRDCAVRCYGADCLRAHDCVIIIGSSLPTPSQAETAAFPSYTLESGERVTVPWTSSAAAQARTAAAPSVLPSFLGALGGGLASLGSHAHMEMKEIRAVFKVLTPDSARGTLIYTVDPRAAIPTFLLHFAIKNLAGLLLYLLQTQAAKVHSDPDCKHAARMRDNEQFYKNWLLPKFRDYCAFRGWPQPTISALRAAGLAPSHWPAPQYQQEEEEEQEEEGADTVATGVEDRQAAVEGGLSLEADAVRASPMPASDAPLATTLASAIEGLMIDVEEHVHDQAIPSSAPNPNASSTTNPHPGDAKPVTITSTVERLLDVTTPPAQQQYA